MGRKSKLFKNLPTWKIRLTIWFEQLKKDLTSRGVLENSPKIGLTAIFHAAYDDGRFIPSVQNTFENWPRKRNYPQKENLTGLLLLSVGSGSWLQPVVDFCVEEELLNCKGKQKSDSNARGAILKTLDEQAVFNIDTEKVIFKIFPEQALLNSIDYYICSLDERITPSLFSHDEQNKFASCYLIHILNKWEQKNVSYDIGYSLLKTHERSAVPLYLCSLASNSVLIEGEVYSWYLDLLCSVLIVVAEFQLEKIDSKEAVENHEKYSLGTQSNLLSALIKFLLNNDSLPLLSFLTARHDCFNEISDPTSLIEHIMLGDTQLRAKLCLLGSDYSELTSLLSFKTSEFIEKGGKLLPLQKRTVINLPTSNVASHTNIAGGKVIYHLRFGQPIIVIRDDVLVGCKAPDKTEDSQYSYSYGGESVYKMAYTLLFDLFNIDNYSVIKVEPIREQVELVVFKLLSRLNEGYDYEISSDQLLHAISYPVVERGRESNTEIYNLYMRSFGATA